MATERGAPSLDGRASGLKAASSKAGGGGGWRGVVLEFEAALPLPTFGGCSTAVAGSMDRIWAHRGLMRWKSEEGSLP